ncbi:MAG TPA: Gp37 family protein [Candidatus Binataceae bacterium]|nr:Gp37 family protein [Candidatus Binataceae bacterium]
MSVAAFNLDDPTTYPGEQFAPPVATDPGTIQTAVIAQLKAAQPNFPAMAGIEIDGFPDDAESWRAVNQIGTVLVRYEGSKYGEIEDVGIVAQSREMKFRLGILARGLGWSDAAGTSPQGAYSILSACLSALLGFKIPGCSKIHAADDEFIRRDKQGAIWIYALDLIIPTYVVEAPAASAWPALSKVNVNNQVRMRGVAGDFDQAAEGDFDDLSGAGGDFDTLSEIASDLVSGESVSTEDKP